jgi:DNA topoisomerase-6 subunit B
LEVFEEISPADFFYRNRDIAGFTNPTRAIYSAIRELVENSLDACDLYRIKPEIYLRISQISSRGEGPEVYRIRIRDNGIGVPPEAIPSAFGQVLYGSKYKLRQTRGTFGLGGKMALLYGQITTHSEAVIISSTGAKKIYEYHLRIDIQNNRPIVLKRAEHENADRWRGTIIEFSMEGDYTRAMPKVLEYLKQTAIVTPYADITFVDPRGRLYRFSGIDSAMPKPPTETLYHPHGVDVETLNRLIKSTRARTLEEFLKRHFQRIGDRTARAFLEYAKFNPKRDPKGLSPEEVVALANAMKGFDFLPPDASCLSPLGEELLEAGIRKELNPEFVSALTRRPSTYSGYPFIVEVGIAYGGGVQASGGITLYRFANKIPLLFDEASDVSWKVVNNLIDWRRYKVSPDMPVAVFVHICSTKIPYKTVGKEFIADRPEVEREILNAVREVARRLSLYLSKKEYAERERRKLDVFQKYLPKIAEFSAKLAGKEVPDIRPLLRRASRIEAA